MRVNWEKGRRKRVSGLSERGDDVEGRGERGMVKRGKWKWK